MRPSRKQAGCEVTVLGAQESDGPQVSPSPTMAHSLYCYIGNDHEDTRRRTKQSQSAWVQIQPFHLLTSDPGNDIQAFQSYFLCL